MKKLIAYIFILSVFSTSVAQVEINRVLFIGNSYIYVNNLPQLLADAASSVGDSIIFDSNTPGGYTLQEHSMNPTTLAKIAEGGWDYVVLQEQSQLPSYPIEDVITDVFPYAEYLDSLINAENECAETIFYMTWGRRDGDTANCWWWPPVCTYEGMDSLLRERYLMMADSNDAIVSPVGAVWHYIRDNYPEIQLYNADGSHPSPYGSYAAACSFYTVIFRKDPSLITFDSDIPATDAEHIRQAAKAIVFDSLSTWFVGDYDLDAAFTSELTGPNEYTFTNYSVNAESYFWDFGDGVTSAVENPVHVFAAPGFYNVVLTALTACDQDITIATIEVSDDESANNIQFPEFEISTIAIDYLEIHSPANIIYHFNVIGMNGEILINGEISGDDRLPLTALPPGIYYLQLISGDSEASKPFIKIAG